MEYSFTFCFFSESIITSSISYFKQTNDKRRQPQRAVQTWCREDGCSGSCRLTQGRRQQRVVQPGAGKVAAAGGTDWCREGGSSHKEASAVGCADWRQEWSNKCRADWHQEWKNMECTDR